MHTVAARWPCKPEALAPFVHLVLSFMLLMLPQKSISYIAVAYAKDDGTCTDQPCFHKVSDVPAGAGVITVDIDVSHGQCTDRTLCMYALRSPRASAVLHCFGACMCDCSAGGMCMDAHPWFACHCHSSTGLRCRRAPHSLWLLVARQRAAGLHVQSHSRRDVPAVMHTMARSRTYSPMRQFAPRATTSSATSAAPSWSRCALACCAMC
jgi:hypothetical protein